MYNYKINETVLIAKSNNPFSIAGEAFKISAISIDSVTGHIIIIVQNLNLDTSDTKFTPESFAVREDRLNQIFEVAEETVAEMNFPDFGPLMHIQLTDIEQGLFGRILSEKERKDIMEDIGVSLTTTQMVSGPKELIGEILVPKVKLDSFSIGEEYELIDIAMSEYLKRIVYVFKHGKVIISFETQSNILNFFEKK